MYERRTKMIGMMNRHFNEGLMKVNTDDFCHVQERALERYGIVLSLTDIRRITQQIVSGEAPVEYRRSNNIVVYKVEHEGINIYPLYSHKIGYVKTIVTKSMIDKWISNKKKAKRYRSRHGYNK